MLSTLPKANEKANGNQLTTPMRPKTPQAPADCTSSGIVVAESMTTKGKNGTEGQRDRGKREDAQPCLLSHNPTTRGQISPLNLPPHGEHVLQSVLVLTLHERILIHADMLTYNYILSSVERRHVAAPRRSCCGLSISSEDWDGLLDEFLPDRSSQRQSQMPRNAHLFG
jgi:hypothetical protein